MKFVAPLALFSILVLLGLGGCASTPKPSVAQISVSTHPHVNPDAEGRASPVIVRFYELTSLAAFNGADFFSVFDRDKETLGAELLAREEFQLYPGQQKQFARQLQADTRFLGVIAAFRDIEHSQWRTSVAITPHKTSQVPIKLDGNKIMSGSP